MFEVGVIGFVQRRHPSDSGIRLFWYCSGIIEADGGVGSIVGDFLLFIVVDGLMSGLEATRATSYLLDVGDVQWDPLRSIVFDSRFKNDTFDGPVTLAMCVVKKQLNSQVKAHAYGITGD